MVKKERILDNLLIFMKSLMEKHGFTKENFELMTNIPTEMKKSYEQLGITCIEDFNKKFSYLQQDLNEAIKFGVANEYIEYAHSKNKGLQQASCNPIKLTSSGLQRAQKLIGSGEIYISIDAKLSELLKKAEMLFSDGELDGALEKIWDAFERIKTILDEDKKKGVKKLCEICATSLSKEEIEAEFKKLTEIGNKYHIRHFETSKIPLKDEVTKRYLYSRMNSLLEFVIKQTKV